MIHLSRCQQAILGQSEQCDFACNVRRWPVHVRRSMLVDSAHYNHNCKQTVISFAARGTSVFVPVAQHFHIASNLDERRRWNVEVPFALASLRAVRAAMTE